MSELTEVSEPDWFRRAVATPRESRFVEVDGARIHYDIWIEGAGRKPTLVFVHGNGAHSHWWDFIVPSFRENFNVVAMDMSGAGDSDHRERYSAITFADEIAGVCTAETAQDQGCYIVGHSFGGTITRITAWLHDRLADGIVLVDSGIATRRGNRRRPRRPRSKSHYYASIEEGMRRFRLRPPQPCDNHFILDYIARHSLKATDQGWCFKLDQSMFSKMEEDASIDLPDATTMVREIACPVGFIYGEQSRFFPPTNVELLKSIVDPALLIGIPDAHHHVFLDQPCAFIDSLSLILDRLIVSE